MKIVVTGAAGFIGSSTCDALRSRGDTVVGIDNFDPYYDPALKWHNLENALADGHFTLHQADIRDVAAMDAIIGAAAPDVVVHLAARAGVRPSLLDPHVYFDVNVMGTESIFRAIRRHGVPHAVLASSSSVYGATSRPPFREDEPADQPSSPYAATKRANEVAAYAHHHIWGTTITLLRFFTAYGPRQRPEMAIHRFAGLIAAGRPVPMFGDGTTARDYTFIDDIVAGVLASIDRPNGYRIYNLGTTTQVPLHDLITLLAARLGRSARVDQLPAQEGDVPLTHADISLARRELGYEPRTDIDDGLDRFIDWFRAESAMSDTGYFASVPA
ncbi:MAG: dTDP-glucose 4,6-dehydratase [Streptosporangiaceae bacterium]|jgi:UDP-glucuronate 4-epimerase|nr:dTDP-glucose 4,6-dehydratase [Streptosporangiaceae bacterium]